MQLLKNGLTTPKLHEVAGDETPRFAMHHINAERITTPYGDKMRCAATDGRVLAIVDFDADPEDVTGLIGADAWKAASAIKPDKRGRWGPQLVANGNVVVMGKPGVVTNFDRPSIDEGEFPRYQALVPAYAPLGGRAKECDEYTGAVAFNPHFLAALVAAIGCNPESPSIKMTLKLKMVDEVVPVLDADGQPINGYVVGKHEFLGDAEAGEFESQGETVRYIKSSTAGVLTRKSGQKIPAIVAHQPIVLTNGNRDCLGVLMPISIA